MHYAAMGNCTEMLRFLLRGFASQNDPDGNKRTPLSWAAEYGALNAAIILVQSGAKVNQTDDMFATPLTWVIQFGPGDQSAIAACLRAWRNREGFQKALDLGGVGTARRSSRCRFCKTMKPELV